MRKSGVPREQLFISSKLYPTGGYESTLAACAASLERLGMDYLDLYLIHWPGGGSAKRKESWRAMEELLASGKVRAIGVSNYMQPHIQEIIDDAALSVVPHVNQCELHPQCQWTELRGFCADNNVQFMGCAQPLPLLYPPLPWPEPDRIDIMPSVCRHAFRRAGRAAAPRGRGGRGGGGGERCAGPGRHPGADPRALRTAPDGRRRHPTLPGAHAPLPFQEHLLTSLPSIAWVWRMSSFGA